MQPIAIELNDRMLSLARGGRVMASANRATGEGAAGESLTFELGQLMREYPLAGDERTWIASSALADVRQLGEILDVSRGAGLRTEGFVDAAAVTVASLALERNALVLELGLRQVAVTEIEGGVQARRRRTLVSRRGGLNDLHEAWLDLISAAMVKQTRFDPLHNVTTEQQLRAALPAMMQQAATEASTTASVSVGSERFEVALSRDQFAATGQPIYQEILRMLHELRRAGAPLALIMPVSTATLPGLRELLQEFVGCELIAVQDGFAGAATSLLDLPQQQDDQTVSLLRRLPSRERAELSDLVSRESLGIERVSGPAASHVLFAGRAYSLGSALYVGRAPGTAQSVILPDGLAGVSRRHCTFISAAGESTLIDHSHFGTFLNGERVAERARVYAGDRVRLGDPGVELSLISLG